MDKNCFEIDFIESATQRFHFGWWKWQVNRFDGSRYVEKSQRKKAKKFSFRQTKTRGIKSTYSQWEILEN